MRRGIANVLLALCLCLFLLPVCAGAEGGDQPAVVLPGVGGDSGNAGEDGGIAPMSIVPDVPDTDGNGVSTEYIVIRFREVNADPATEVKEDTARDTNDGSGTSLNGYIPAYRQIVKLGDTINKPGTDRIGLAENEAFLGWYRGIDLDGVNSPKEGAKALETGYEVTDADIQAAQKDGKTVTISNGVNEVTYYYLTYYPVTTRVHQVHFHDELGVVMSSQQAYPVEGKEEDCEVAPEAWPKPDRLTLGKFVCWIDVNPADIGGQLESGETIQDIRDAVASGNLGKYKYEPGSQIDNEHPHVIEAGVNIHKLAIDQPEDGVNPFNVNLWAVYSPMHYVTFDSLGGTSVAALYVEPNVEIKFDSNGDITNYQEYGDAYAAPTKEGYVFAGWSTDTETVDGVTSGKKDTKATTQTITQGVTYYAIWTPSTETKYTIQYWVEDTTDSSYDNKNWLDENGNVVNTPVGDYPAVQLYSTTRNGTTGEMVKVTDDLALTNFEGSGVTEEQFAAYYALDTARNANSSVTVAADGTSVLNVYYYLVPQVIYFDFTGWQWESYNEDGSSGAYLNSNNGVTRTVSPAIFTINGKSYTADDKTAARDGADQNDTCEYKMAIKLGQKINELFPNSSQVTETAILTVTWRGDSWGGENGQPHEYYLQGWLANGASTSLRFGSDYATGQTIKESPYVASWSTTAKMTHLYFWFESTDQSTPENNTNRVLYNGTYYDLDTGNTTQLRSTAQQWSPKAITGYTPIEGKQSRSVADNGDYYYNFYYSRAAYTLTLNNTSTANTQDVKHGTELNAGNYLAQPQKPDGYDDHYVFLGWFDVPLSDITVTHGAYDSASGTYDQATGGDPKTEPEALKTATMPMNNYTLYALWYRPEISYTFTVIVNGTDYVYTGSDLEGKHFRDMDCYTEALGIAEAYARTSEQIITGWVYSNEEHPDKDNPDSGDWETFNLDAPFAENIKYIMPVFSKSESYNVTYLVDETYLTVPANGEDGKPAYQRSTKGYTGDEDSGPQLLTLEAVAAQSQEAGYGGYTLKKSIYKLDKDGNQVADVSRPGQFMQTHYFAYWMECDKDGKIIGSTPYRPGDQIGIKGDTYVIPVFLPAPEEATLTYHWNLPNSNVNSISMVKYRLIS